jgi:hypothetical protein
MSGREWSCETPSSKRNNGISIAFEGEEPNIATGYDEVDQIFGRARVSLEGTKTTYPQDARIVQ